MNLKLDGRLAVVTGADSGIGLRTACTLAAEGAKVLMTDQFDQELEEALVQVKTESGNDNVHCIVADLTDPDAVKTLKFMADELGGADVLAHLAGSRGASGDFINLDEKDWKETLDIDLLAAVRVCKALIPGMLIRGYGRIVLCASENATQPSREEAPYNVAKAGIINLAKGLSKAYGEKGVHVNVVSPAFIETPMTNRMMEQRADTRGEGFQETVESFLKEQRPGITLGRRGTPQEVANVITFLCSNAASFVDGSNYRVDGGSVATAFG